MRSLFFAEFNGERLSLKGSEGHHAADVLRIKVGEEIEVSDGGRLAVAVVTNVGRSFLEADIVNVTAIAESLPDVTVAQAVLKGEAMADAVDLMTQTGVARIIPWYAEHSIGRSDLERSRKVQQRMETAAFAAAKQSRRPRVPTVDSPLDFSEMLDGAGAFDVAIALHEGASVALSGREWAGVASVLLIVGPEGGLSADELQSIADRGIETCLLGPTVLRSAVAGAVAATVVFSASSWRNQG